MSKIIMNKQGERKQIKLNYEMGFINYQEFVEQMMDTMDYQERKAVGLCLQSVLDSEEVLMIRRELQHRIDSIIAHHPIITSIISEL